MPLQSFGSNWPFAPTVAVAPGEGEGLGVGEVLLAVGLGVGLGDFFFFPFSGLAPTAIVRQRVRETRKIPGQNARRAAPEFFRIA